MAARTFLNPITHGEASTPLPVRNMSSNRSTPSGVWIIATALFALLIWVAPRYGYFRDELYYMACGEHPAWGYVDQPPLIGWIAWLLQHTIGTSLYALRLLPALAASTTAWLTARLARELGGGSRAQVLAALLAAVMPVAITMAHLFTMNAFDLALWTALALILVRNENTGDSRLWIAFGAIAGVTILNKYGVVFFLFALLAGILATSWRRWFANTYFWMGILLTIFIALPNFLWQQQRHFPFLELMRNIRRNGRDIALPPFGFFLQQLQIVNPVSMLAVSLEQYGFSQAALSRPRHRFCRFLPCADADEGEELLPRSCVSHDVRRRSSGPHALDRSASLALDSLRDGSARAGCFWSPASPVYPSA